MGRRKEENKYTGVTPASQTTIEVRFGYPTPTDEQRERIKLEPTPANLKRAYLFLEDVKQSIKEGTFDYAVSFPTSPRAKKFQNRRLLRTYAQHWLEEHKYDYDDSTYKGYKKIIDNQLGWLGGMRMEAVVWGDIVKFVRALYVWKKDEDGNRYKATMSQKTIGNKLSPLRHCYQFAVDVDGFNNNPFALHPKNPKPKRYESEDVDLIEEDNIDPFSKEEIQAILAACKFKQHRNLILFGFNTGMRISELMGLEWKQIDFIKKELKVDRKRTTGAKKATKPKTAASRRDVDLNSLAMSAINSQKQFTYLEGKEVFHNPRQMRRWDSDAEIRQRMWGTILKRAGVRYRPPGQMRHTWASTALSTGEDSYYVAARMGHTNPEFTMRVYQRFIETVQIDSGSKLEAYFSDLTEGV